MRLRYVANARLPTEKAHGWQIAKMCEAFAAHGVDVEVWHPRRKQPSELRGRTLFEFYGLPQAFRDRILPNVDVVRLERYVPRSLFRAVFMLHAFAWAEMAARRARVEQPDLCFTRNLPTALMLARYGLPTVVEVHRLPGRTDSLTLRRMLRRRELRLVVAMTHHIRKELLDVGLSSRGVVVEPDAVDLRPFRALPDRNSCREKVGLPRDVPVVGYVGRFEALGMEKGIEVLIRSIGRVRGARPLLLCVGGPMDRVPEYRRIAEEAGLSDGRVRFVDRVPNGDVPWWIAACDVATIPWPWTSFSAYSTSPLKLFEYMAAGVPVIASKLPALEEVLRHDRNAYLVPPGDSEALASGIERVLMDPLLAARLAKEGMNDVARFTWEKRAGRILSQVGY